MNFDIREWKGLSSASISDAMKGSQTMKADIKPLRRTDQVVGPAYTVQIIDKDCTAVFRALRDACPGDVLVIAAQGMMDIAFLGEIIATIAKNRGLAGIVIDGCIRDSRAIAEMDFPVFSKGAISNSPAVNYLSRVQQPVNCSGVMVYPGDFIYGDADGVVVVSPSKKDEILYQAKIKEQNDLWKLNEVIPDSKLLEAFLTKACGDDRVQDLVTMKGDLNDETYLA